MAEIVIPAPKLEPLPPPSTVRRLKLKLVNLTEHERIREGTEETSHYWKLEYEIVAQPGYGIWQIVSTKYQAAWVHSMIYQAFHRNYDPKIDSLDGKQAADLWIGREVMGVIHYMEHPPYTGWQLKRVEHP